MIYIVLVDEVGGAHGKKFKKGDKVRHDQFSYGVVPTLLQKEFIGLVSNEEESAQVTEALAEKPETAEEIEKALLEKKPEEMTVPELKSVLDSKGISYKGNASKPQLLAQVTEALAI